VEKLFHTQVQVCQDSQAFPVEVDFFLDELQAFSAGRVLPDRRLAFKLSISAWSWSESVRPAARSSS
jgi:hypothetical protein